VSQPPRTALAAQRIERALTRALPLHLQEARATRPIGAARTKQPLEDDMNISQAPQGIHLVVETDEAVYIGRMGKTEGDRARMHHAVVIEVGSGENPEPKIRHTAKYGVEVQHADLLFETTGIKRIRKLGDVPKG
jgi:hypothetical protein